MRQEDLQVAVNNAVVRAQAAYREAKREEDAALATAVAEHASMPANYWQTRFRAEARLRATQRLVEALK